ncbi:MAG: transcriptional regulator [Nitrosopumilus sp.]|nr:MAG: transcriptional regulator [Nitrosopumilus sp.]
MIPLQQHLEEFGMRNCPLEISLRIIGKKFTIHIIRNMILLKQTRFNEFLNSMEGISTKTLSVRLREMEDAGLITRNIIEKRPLRVEYHLTEKGKALAPVMIQMANFSMRWESKKVFKNEEPSTIKETFGTERLAKVWD